MAEQVSDKVDVTAPTVEAPEAPSTDVAIEQGNSATMAEAKSGDNEAGKGAQSDDKAGEATTASDENAKTVEKSETGADSETKGVTEAPPTEEAPAADATATETPSAKNKNRRKSTGGDNKGKTLSKKASKAKITHTDAKPGDHFLVKLKGFPAWPAIVCDESMLPQALVTSRPVTAAKPDGTYNDNYADGGKRVNDRTFPVMYLSTNEFGWVANTSFSDLSPEKARDTINDKMRKDLKAAFELAAEAHSIDHYKGVLKDFQETLIQQMKDEAAAAATPKKSKKAKLVDEDEDVDMADVGESAKAKSKKRKADDATSTPQRSDSVKKPKIKLNTSSTPKTANGAAAPVAKDESATKPTKPKQKKTKDASEKKEKAEKADTKEAKGTPEERRARKEKEVMYLRHKLQRGLLTREQQPQENEMQQMADYIGLLEKFNDLEVSIIRATKINKVLKAILKLDAIPKESEFKFKERSQALLDQWNKLIAGDAGASISTGTTNGINGSAATEKKSASNGAGEQASPEVKKSEIAPSADSKVEGASSPKDTEQAEKIEERDDTPAKPEATAATSDAVEAAA